MSYDVSLLQVLSRNEPHSKLSNSFVAPVAPPSPTIVTASASPSVFRLSRENLATPIVAVVVATGFAISIVSKVVRQRRQPPRGISPARNAAPPRAEPHTIASVAESSPLEVESSDDVGFAETETSSPNSAGSPTVSTHTSNNRYEKLEYLGRGAFGVVHKGRHRRTGDLVAIKEMAAAQVNELKVEYDILVHLPPHENIVKVLAFDLTRHHARLYLEWMAGGSLADSIRKYPLEEPLARSYVRQMLQGLQFLHENGIIHRDVKPRNMLIDHRGVLKLTDFGLSRHVASMRDRTRIGGTLAYLAPEGAMGNFGPGSDIWAVGATLSEMLTRKVPWSHLDANICCDEAPFLFHLGAFRGQAGHHPTIPRNLECLSLAGQQFMEKLFAPFPGMRGSCAELLQHPWFTACGDEEGESQMASREGSKLFPTAAQFAEGETPHSSSGNTFSQTSNVSK